jgi:hypothetical protein
MNGSYFVEREDMNPFQGQTLGNYSSPAFLQAFTHQASPQTSERLEWRSCQAAVGLQRRCGPWPRVEVDELIWLTR